MLITAEPKLKHIMNPGIIEEVKTMSYTIASFETHSGDYSVHLDIGKKGNKYIVTLYSDEMPHVYNHNTFDSLQAAYAVYEKLVSWCVYGYYSLDNKREYLIIGTMK